MQMLKNVGPYHNILYLTRTYSVCLIKIEIFLNINSNQKKIYMYPNTYHLDANRRKITKMSGK